MHSRWKTCEQTSEPYTASPSATTAKQIVHGSLGSRWRRAGVQLSLAEVLSLHFGRTLFNFLDGTSFAEDLTGAIERLEPAISRADAHLARQLDTKFVAVPEPSKRWSERCSRHYGQRRQRWHFESDLRRRPRDGSLLRNAS